MYGGLLFRVFRYYFLLGADWKLCCRQLGMDRGNFFHAVYRIEQKLGRVFAELDPYGLDPVDEYFGGPIRRAPIRRFRASFEGALLPNTAGRVSQLLVSSG